MTYLLCYSSLNRLFCPLEQFEPVVFNLMTYLTNSEVFGSFKNAYELPKNSFNGSVLSFFNSEFYFSAYNYYYKTPVTCIFGTLWTEFFILLVLVFGFYGFIYLSTGLFLLRMNYPMILLISAFRFVYSLFVENCSSKLYYFYVLIFLLFFNICLFNYLGMLPYTFTMTSHIIFTLNYSFLFFFGLNILSVFLYGFYFLGLFLPSGSPLVISSFLILIELISYVARLFSLAIRLFANLMSGHTLLNILASFSWSMLSNAGLFLLGSIVVLFVIFLIVGLESAIAFLQGYVFTILLIIYFNDALSALAH